MTRQELNRQFEQQISDGSNKCYIYNLDAGNDGRIYTYADPLNAWRIYLICAIANGILPESEREDLLSRR